MSVQEIVRSLIGTTTRCILALVLAIILVAPVLAQDYIGPADDPYYPPPFEDKSEVPPPSTINDKIGGGGTGDTVFIETVDPTMFPQICTYVTVTHNGTTLPGLDPDSFCVRQDGIVIDSFTAVQQTLDSCITKICLVIDKSGSMADGGKMTAAKNAALAMMREMDQYDQMAIVSFSDCYNVLVNFTSDTVPIKAAITGLSASGRTAAFDGTWAGVEVTKLLTGSKAVIALTDGLENRSGSCAGAPDGLGDGFADDSTLIVSLAKNSSVPIYSITLGGDFEVRYMKGLALGSGGGYYHAPTGDQLEDIYLAIKERLCRRYLICYTSPDTILNGDCHTLVICRDSADADKTGGTPDCYVCDTTVFCEPSPPVITIEVDPACRRWGHPVQLCANVNDSDTPASALLVKLFYRIYEPGGAFLEVTPTRNGNEFCYTIPAAFIPCGKDSIEFYFTATDSVSSVASPPNAPSSSHQVTICQNHPPTCEFGPDLAPPLCNPVSPIDFVPLNLTDVDNNKVDCYLYGDGQLVPGGWQNNNVVPGDTAHVYIVCIDSCGDSCNIEFDRAYPERELIPCNLPDGGDTAFFGCHGGPISIPVSGGEGAGCELIEGAGQLINGNWYYPATKDTVITFVIQCVGLCDSCRSTYTVAININEPPICGPSQNPSASPTAPCDTTIFLCNPGRVCVSVTAATDPDGNLDSCHLVPGSGPGTFANGLWCFDATATGTYFATIECRDSCNETCSRVICATVVIDEAPVITCPPDVVYECDSVGGFGSPTVVDDGFAPATVDRVVTDSVPGNCPGTYTLRIRYIASDSCDHSDTCFQSVQVIDTTAPVIACPDPAAYSCESVPAEFLPPSATDNCDPNPVVTELFAISTPSALCPQEYSMSIAWEARDACGNADTCVQSIFVYDSTPPVVDCPDDTTLSCTDEFPIPGGLKGITPGVDFKTIPNPWPFGVPTGTDNCDDAPLLSGRFGEILDRDSCHFVFEAIYVAEDNCGNKDTCVQIVTVVDTLDPVIECPVSLRYECDEIPTSFPPPNATDACNSVTVTEIDRFKQDSLCPYEYTLVIVWEAKDKCGNADTCRQLVEIFDDAAPELTIPQPVTYNCDSVPTEFPMPTAQDQCDPNPRVDLFDVHTIVTGCVTEFSLQWVATDACGNFTEPYTQIVIVLDRTAPEITCPDTLVFECDSVPDIDSLPKPTVVNNCDDSLKLERFLASSTNAECPQGYHMTILWVATDDCGNADSCTQVVNVVDTTAPVLVDCDTLIVFECTIFNKDAQSISPILPTATDNCDVSPDVRYTYGSSGGTWGCDYHITFNIYAIDGCGNISDTCFQTIRVIDTTPPQIVCADTLVVECPNQVILVPPPATDNCPGYPVNVIAIGSRTEDSTCYGSYRWVITWEATDHCGLKDTCEQVIRYRDTTPPVLTCDAVRYECDSIPTEWTKPGAIDLCDPSPVVTLLSNSDTTVGGCPQRYSFILTWEAKDACGNADTCEQTVYIYDETAPEVTCPNDTIVACQDIPPGLFASAGVATTSTKVPVAPYPFGMPVAKDNCDPSPEIHWFVKEQSGVYPCDKRFVIGYYSVDSCGNVSDTCFQNASIVDTLAPDLTCPDDTTLECDELLPTVKFASVGDDLKDANGYPFGTPTATDNCSQFQILGPYYWREVSRDSCGYVFEAMYIALDACQNADTCFQIITVVDTTAPVVDCADDTTVYCSANGIPPCFDDKSSGKTGEKFLCDFRLIDTVYDACDDFIEYQYSLFYQTAQCPRYIRAKIWAVDDCGNISDTCLWTAYFVDTTDPVITCPPDINAECGTNPGDWGTATATDDCGGQPVIALIDVDTIAQNSCYLEVTRTFTATDFCGNADTCTQLIVIGDSTDPVITCPPDTVVSCEELRDREGKSMLMSLADLAPKALGSPCDGPLGNYDYRYGRPTVTDNCSEFEACLYDVVPGYIDSCRVDVILKFVAIDACGNYDTCSQVVSFIDKAGPVLVCAPDTTIYCDRDKATCIQLKGTETFELKSDEKFLCGFRMVDTVYDACCDDVKTYARLTYHMNICPSYIKAFIWAIDCCGNYSDTCTWILNIADTAAPVMTCPPDVTFECDDQQTDWGWPTAVDNCDGPVVITLIDQDTLSEGCAKIITRSFSAKDRCNLESRCQQRITISDTTDPVCIVPNDTTIFICAPGQQICLPVSGTDNCDQSVVCEVVDGAGTIANGQWCFTPTGPGPVTAYVRCSDDCGNYCSSDFTVTFALNRAPECHLPNDTVIYQCDPAPILLYGWVGDLDGNLQVCSLSVDFPEVKAEKGLDADSETVTISINTEKDLYACVYIKCVDSCGAVCYDTFCVRVEITEPPACYQTPDTTVTMCNPALVCIQTDYLIPAGTTSDVTQPRPATKGKGKGAAPRPVLPQTKALLVGCEITSGPGYLNNGYWCWTPPDFDTTVYITVVCADTCQHICTNEFVVNFDMNENPVCSLLVDLVDPICTPDTDFVPYNSIDPDGETECYLVGPGALVPGGWQFTDPVPGTSVTVKIVCADTCGDSCVIDFTRNYPELVPVVCRVPEAIDTVLCQPDLLHFAVGSTDGAECRIVSGPGNVDGGTWTYYADHDTSFCVTIECKSLCDSCRAEFCVTIDMNDPPVCELPNDTTIFLCVPGTVCLPIGATDVNNNFSHCEFDDPSKIGGSGYICDASCGDNVGDWCYDVTEDTKVTVYIRCLDSCGAFCTGSFTVTFDVNEAPTCDEVADTSVFLCGPTPICLPFGSKDNDGQVVTCQVIAGPGSYEQGQWCFTPQSEGVYNVTIRCADECGAYCDESFAVTVDFNEAPVCSGPTGDTTIFLCSPGQVCIGWGATDPNNNLLECIVVDDDKGTPNPAGGVQWCDFVSVEFTKDFLIRCTDSCGAICERTLTVHFVLNDPPVINLGDDIATLVGDGEVCFNYTVSDPQGFAGLIEQMWVFPPGATIDTLANTICWTPEDSGTFTFVASVHDSCNAYDFDTALVFVAQPQPPACNLPGDTVIFQCAPVQINLPVSATSLYSPVNCVVTSGPGSVSGGFWRYTPPGPGEYNVTITCTDSKGGQCNGSFKVTILGNTPPTCNIRDTSIFICDPTQICIPMTATDPDGNLVSKVKVSGPGTLTNGTWCYNATADASFSVTFRCTDACGQFCEKTVYININMNESPHCSFPDNQTVILCPGDMICFGLQGSDPDGNFKVCGVKDGLGEVLPTGPNGQYEWCYRPTGSGVVPVTVFCADSCGDTCFTPRQFTVLFNTPQYCGSQTSGQIIHIGPASVTLAGDVNGSGQVDVADIALLTMIVNALDHKGRSTGIRAESASAGYELRGDVDCDGKLDRTDIATLAEYLFNNGPEPCELK